MFALKPDPTFSMPSRSEDAAKLKSSLAAEAKTTNSVHRVAAIHDKVGTKILAKTTNSIHMMTAIHDKVGTKILAKTTKSIYMMTAIHDKQRS